MLKAIKIYHFLGSVSFVYDSVFLEAGGMRWTPSRKPLLQHLHTLRCVASWHLWLVEMDNCSMRSPRYWAMIPA